MLYDPRWEPKETKADPEFSGVRLSEFIAWLETKPANEVYDYTQPRHCATGQFLTSRGAEEVCLSLAHPEAQWLDKIVHPMQLEEITFGIALERARAYRASL